MKVNAQPNEVMIMRVRVLRNEKENNENGCGRRRKKNHGKKLSRLSFG